MREMLHEIAALKELADVLGMILSSGDTTSRDHEISRLREKILVSARVLEEMSLALISDPKDYMLRREDGRPSPSPCEFLSLGREPEWRLLGDRGHVLHALYEQLERIVGMVDSSGERAGGAERIREIAACMEEMKLKLRNGFVRAFLGAALRSKREDLGMTVREAAEHMDISASYLSRIENARCNLPSSRVRRRICSFLDL